MTYGILLWGSASKKYLTKIFKIQKRALRIISNSSYLCHTKPLFENYNTLNIFELYEKELCIFMYKYKYNLLPQSFNKCFTSNNDFHNYDTRNKENFNTRISKVKNLFTNGPKIWNDLPTEFKPAKPFQFNVNKGQLPINMLYPCIMYECIHINCY